MSSAAFKRDVNDPQTIADFANIVQSPERLRLLLVLTVADIRAVGPNVWNGWKAALLRELYWRAEEVLSGEAGTAGPDARARMVHDELRSRLADWDDDSFAAHAERANTSYWLGRDVDTLERHARLIDRAERDGEDLTIDFRVDGFREVTEVTVLTADHPGLFARLTGGMAAAGANIVDARISTLRDGTVLDSFWIQDADGTAFDDPDSLRRLRVTVAGAVRGELDLDDALNRRRASVPGRVRSMTVATRVLIDNRASNTHTVIEVNGADRPGLLYRLTRALAGLNLQISSAKISTFGISIVDVFYVKDLFGLKVEADRQLEAIRRDMQAELHAPERGGDARQAG